MTLDDALGVKNMLFGAPTITQPGSDDIGGPAGRIRSFDAIDVLTPSASARTPAPRMVKRGVAIGIAKKGRRNYQIALRLQKPTLLNHQYVENIKREAAGEVDIRYIGRITKRARTPWYRIESRPIRIGCSIGHFKSTAGTLGCFVTDQHGTPFILSNNHVLANENTARAGDKIYQPGKLDGGRIKHLIGPLGKFIRLKKRDNLVDAAICEIFEDVEFIPDLLNGFPKGSRALRKPASPESIDIGDRVRKIGRTTGFTEGRITAFEVDNVEIEYDSGWKSFDDQIEIEGTGKAPFSDGGDSGSLIVDSRNRPIGLLFAGGTEGGSNGKGFTYANPINVVFSSLNISLLL